MNETPEAIRERVHAEELSKGSDPRVAEARAKAAEARARHGLPIDPQQAWKAKLQQEGGTPSASDSKPAVAEPAAPTPEEPAAAAPDEDVVESEAPVPPEPEPAGQEQPAETVPSGFASIPGAAPTLAPEFDVEVGEPISDSPPPVMVAGVEVRDAPIPRWALALCIAIALWALMYVVVMSGSDVAFSTTGCKVEANRTFTCFHSGESGASESSGGGH